MSIEDDIRRMQEDGELESVTHVPYETMVHRLYEGQLPVIIFMGARNFWVFFEPPKTSRVYTDPDGHREVHIARLISQVGAAAWRLQS